MDYIKQISINTSKSRNFYQKIQNLPLFLSIDRLENSQQLQLAP